ncbi:MAG TPA: tryptophan 7-halogenase [Anaerolineales bacterium]|nr:tryptophan 7-halogenase [Anaerolineales bacterium]
MSDQREFDVVICGGGLAGLTLARHLKLDQPELSVAVIDRLTRPLPEAAFKVGESSIELGTYYFGQVLKLDRYFRTKHLPKFGLRFFLGKSHEPLTQRPEAGQTMFPPVPSYQIDRGRLETDLREFVAEMGVILFEGCSVDDIELAEGDTAHIIRCRRKDDSESFTLTGHWVVDALGRRRLLQTKLGLKREHEHRASAAWWRYTGRIDVDVMGTQDGSKFPHQLIEDRYFSTNHMMDRGYWVWFIPLGSGNTSVGIVTDDDIHPQNTYGKSYEQALEWLQKNEPKVWDFVRDLPPMDFLSLKRYSYASAQVFSHTRWSCVGEAGFFLDPLYSYGSDFIAVTNTLTVEMIRRERAGSLTEKMVADYNRLVLDNLYKICLGFYEGMYKIFGHPQIFTPKLTWDTAIYWSWMYQLYVQGMLLNPTEDVFTLGERFRQLNTRVEKLLADWSEKAPPRPLYVLGDMTRMRLMMLLGLDLASRRGPEQMMKIARKNLDRLEEFALVLFWQAVSECYPNHPMLKKKPWVNAWRMHLEPDQWEADGVFEPETASRPLQSMRDNFSGIFGPQSLRERILYNLPYQLLHLGKGFVYYKIVTWIRRIIFVNKPAMWVRWALIKDYPS